MTDDIVPVSELPAVLSATVDERVQHFLERNPDLQDWLQARLRESAFTGQLKRVWACSRFAADLCCRQPQLFVALVDGGDLLCGYDDADMGARLAAEMAGRDSEAAMEAGLRLFRNREMLRIIWRDINRMANLRQTTAEMSSLAESCLQYALDFHHRDLAKKYGRPLASVSGECREQAMVILAMGKLGAWELNLSSDIDLIFTYPHAGQTDGKRSIDNHEFFTRLARKLIHSIDAVTEDGFVFRVDMRLRPYGDSGSLVLSFSAMEQYYQDQGRDWERYAMIKARVVSGDAFEGERLMAMLRPFVYRRYIDFSAIDSLRSMKQMIRREVKRRHLDNDVKLGSGGIREIEFIAQCFQLIRGGREPQYQQRRVLEVLEVIAADGLMPAAAIAGLQQAYVFLRNTEHAIQAANDQQTQALPSAEWPRAALAVAMGFGDWDSFSAALQRHRDHVDGQFRAVIAEEPDAVGDAASNGRWLSLWLGHYQPEAALELLAANGFEAPEQTWQLLQQLAGDAHVERMQAVGRERLDQFMPLLLAAVTEAEAPSTTLLRIIPLVESVLRRTAYLVLLVENPGALAQLVLLCASSPWIARELTRYPVLLDELLDVRTLYRVPEKAQLRAELQQQMMRIRRGDLEAHMEGLRYFKLAHQLHVTAAEVTDRLPLMRVSDYLTILAEVVLEYVLELAWTDMVAKYGCPRRTAAQPCDKDFIIVGYGKLGGIELGHGSDLDLVFIHDAASGLATDGDRSLDNNLFFTRLGQRIIHILTAHTASGMLYEVDMRLRPSGASGLLVSSLAAFEHYQRQSAWTWEQQALVRARTVAGDDPLGERFEHLRKTLLCLPRDPGKVRSEVGEMRRKMREHLLPRGLEQRQPPVFHLKQGGGGIVDIEFMVQYAVLIWAHQHPALAVFSDNIRILEALGEAGLFQPAQAQALIDAYKAFRAEDHRLRLLEQACEVTLGGERGAELDAHRQVVLNMWRQLFD